MSKTRDDTEKSIILIVDDVPENLDILKGALSDAYGMRFAISGPLAIRLAHMEPKPDLILLDIMMPGMDGYEVCRRLKEDEQTRNIPIIFVTAMHDDQDQVKGLALGAVDYIIKPISPPVVRARVKTHLEMIRSQQKIMMLNQELTAALTSQKQAYDALNQARLVLAETQAMALMTKSFEKFVPKQFLKCIAVDGVENIQPGTVALSTLTILFSDIRGFTQRAEQMSPEDLFAFLNHYLSRMQIPIEKADGFIDKFIGDAIMALFDGSLPEQTTHAAQAAIGMQHHLSRYNAERAALGEPPILTGIGIHTGPVMLGTLGNEKRMDSTVIGDAANVAARLEGLTKVYGCRIVMSDEIFQWLEKDQFLSRPLDRVVVRGRQQPILVHELFDGDPESERAQKQALLPEYQWGVEQFYARNWSDSQEAFRACLQRLPNDTPSQLYLKRSALLLANPPDDHWNGTFEMLDK